ncbi:MAG: hypothetical protein HFH00_07020 [Dorea sp.]|nr:hypothetical protein [Dorea sp.]
MSVKLIAMLTNNDKTVPGAIDIFENNKMTKADCWGFKDIGIELPAAKELIEKMKRAGKITFMEPLVESEEECLKAAQFAIDCKFEYMVGMAFYESVAEKLKGTGIKYFPTCGRRAGIPRMLYGTHEEIIADAKRILSYEGVHGICLSIYRYKDGDPEEMAREFVKNVDKPMIVTGSISNTERLEFVKKLKPWGFTIGSALFDDSFGAFETISDKIDYILEELSR